MAIEVLNTNGNLPAYASVTKDLGTDDFGTQDTIIPRIKICQPMSTVKQTNQTIRDGQMYNVATGTIYQDIVFFPLLFWRSRIWFSDQLKMRGIEMINSATKEIQHFGPDIELILNDKAQYDQGIDAHNYMFVLASSLTAPEIMIFTAQSAAMKASRSLNAHIMANSNKGIPIYCNRIKMATVLHKFDKGAAYMPVFTPQGVATDEEFVVLQNLYITAKKLQGKEDVHTNEEISEENTVRKSAPQPAAKKKSDPFEDLDPNNPFG